MHVAVLPLEYSGQFVWQYPTGFVTVGRGGGEGDGEAAGGGDATGGGEGDGEAAGGGDGFGGGDAAGGVLGEGAASEQPGTDSSPQ